MGQIEEDIKDLKKDLMMLRDGYGCLSNMGSNDYFTTFLECDMDQDEHNASILLTLITVLMPNKEGETLLAALNLLQGYDYESPDERRLQYYFDSTHNPKKEMKSDTLYRRENKTIQILTEKLIDYKRSKKLKDIVSRASRKLVLHKPRFINNVARSAVVADTPLEQGTAEVLCAKEIEPQDGDSHHICRNVAPHYNAEIFIGREKEIAQIYDGFANQGLRIQTISGMPGVGKTQLALSYISKHDEGYDTIWWITADTIDSINFAIREFINQMGLVAEASSQLSPYSVFREWFENHKKWLLVFDNVEDYASIKPCIPQNNFGHILTTSQLQENYLGKKIDIDVFDEDTAAAFLQRRTESIDQANAKKLAVRLGCLPLALEYSAAYISTTPNMSFTQYRQKLNEAGSRVLDKKAVTPSDYKFTIRETFNMTFKKMHKDAEDSLVKQSALQFVNLCASIAPEGIDVFFWKQYNDYLPEPLKTVITDDIDIDELQWELLRYSLFSQNNGLFSMHRLLHEIIGDNPDYDEGTWFSVVNSTFMHIQSKLEEGALKINESELVQISFHAKVVEASKACKFVGAFRDGIIDEQTYCNCALQAFKNAIFWSNIFYKKEESKSKASYLDDLLGVGLDDFYTYMLMSICILVARANSMFCNDYTCLHNTYKDDDLKRFEEKVGNDEIMFFITLTFILCMSYRHKEQGDIDSSKEWLCHADSCISFAEMYYRKLPPVIKLGKKYDKISGSYVYYNFVDYLKRYKDDISAHLLDGQRKDNIKTVSYVFPGFAIGPDQRSNARCP